MMDYEILSGQFTSQTNPPLYQVNVCLKGWDFQSGNNILFWSFLGALSWVGGMGKSSTVQELLEYKLHF